MNHQDTRTLRKRIPNNPGERVTVGLVGAFLVGFRAEDGSPLNVHQSFFLSCAHGLTMIVTNTPIPYEEENMKPKHLLVLVVALLFALTSAVTFAEEVKWLVIKDKNGKCRVIDSLKDKTEHSIAGPYKTKAEAEKEKERLCAPSAAGKKPDAAKKPEPAKASDKEKKAADKEKKKADEEKKAVDKEKKKAADKEKKKAVDKEKKKADEEKK